MKSFIVLALFVAAAVAAPAGPESLAQVLDQDLDNIGVDAYKYRYKTENNIQAEESGAVQDLGTENEGLEVQGRYSYQGPDGQIYELVYTAGRNGFRPIASYIPTGPVAA